MGPYQYGGRTIPYMGGRMEGKVHISVNDGRRLHLFCGRLDGRVYLFFIAKESSSAEFVFEWEGVESI